MIQGFRRYSLTQNNRLRGATNYVWDEPEVEAECRDSTNAWLHITERRALANKHLLEQTCKCGIYIQHTEDPGKGVDELDFVVAAVTGWGAGVAYWGKDLNDIVGWRMQFARIEHLWLPEIKLAYPKETIPALKDRYGVEITVIPYTLPTALCCTRDHPTELFRDDNGESYTLCKLSVKAINRYAKLYSQMGSNSFALNKLSALNKELIYRTMLEPVA